MEVRIINEYIYMLESASMIEFDSLVNEYTDKIN